ncbi:MULTISPECIES: carbohydrate porin [unclassified Pseudomonas]|uniref:carbohydrate porin n=1 Tax=unclassified Pseudomonas TaxID=196821 RepID=UPI002B22DFB5|nr:MULTISPECIES: carbohydrate porin [unclassified Pseudomonas]
MSDLRDFFHRSFSVNHHLVNLVRRVRRTLTTTSLNVMLNLQYVAHPGGVRDVQNGVVAGLQIQPQFSPLGDRT